MNIVIAICDAIVALALAWVGISVEPRATREACSADLCINHDTGSTVEFD